MIYSIQHVPSLKHLEAAGVRLGETVPLFRWPQTDQHFRLAPMLCFSCLPKILSFLCVQICCVTFVTKKRGRVMRFFSICVFVWNSWPSFFRFPITFWLTIYPHFHFSWILCLKKLFRVEDFSAVSVPFV